MITAEQAYENYVKSKKRSHIENFVLSVLQEVITEERIRATSIRETEADFLFSTILEKIFLTEEVNGFTVNIGWRLDLTDLPEELYGKRNDQIVEELKAKFNNEQEHTFICKAFKQLIKYLVIVCHFEVYLDWEKEVLTVSWDSSSTENT
ncbi:MAG: hypothetical protein IJ272_10285 [Clostridia bacterium]|nr:hypothetical protein [Clostridia bacterium]